MYKDTGNDRTQDRIRERFSIGAHASGFAAPNLASRLLISINFHPVCRLYDPRKTRFPDTGGNVSGTVHRAVRLDSSMHVNSLIRHASARRGK